MEKSCRPSVFSLFVRLRRERIVRVGCENPEFGSGGVKRRGREARTRAFPGS
jgi:hypothetical protein